MTHPGACVRDGLLTVGDGGSERTIPVGGDDWAHWLEQASSTAFRFERGAARFTARRERQRGHWYWYAYRRVAGRLRKAYLGRSSDLTVDRLAEVGARLGMPVDQDAWPRLGDTRHNLPGQLSSFLGREAELGEVRRALRATRLLTLTGPGGVGKTRLALATAAETLGEGADGVWLVELAPVTDPMLVPQAVAQATGIREQPGRPLAATLAAGLGVGRVLLVLDNCEHLLDGCALLADALLRVCPDLRVLATSREPLDVAGEVAWRVLPLGLPTAVEHAPSGEVARAEAVRLFVERAQAARPGFALTAYNAAAVAEICRRLDGIPLALELAAARMRLLAPEEIAERLSDRFGLLTGGGRTAPARQQTLRATVDWSYNLLSEAERRLFERLAVFTGGFSLDAAEAVGASDGGEAAAVLGLLAQLVDRSLVLAELPGGAEPTRYRLLETLRAYGLERLAERPGEADRARERQAAWLTDLAERAMRAYYGPEQGAWLRWAAREHDNARAVLGWVLERGDSGTAVRLVAALAWAWLVQQRWSEGLDWALRTLASADATPTRERGWLLSGAIQLALFRGDLTSNRPSGDLGAVHRWVEELLTVGETLRDDELLLAGRGLQMLLREHGIRIDGPAELSPEEELAFARRMNNAWGECRGLEALARHALHAGDLDGAAVHLTEAVRVARAAGDTWSLAMALNALGDVERACGAHARAGALYEESLDRFADLGLGAQPSLVHNLGYVALAAGNRGGATAHFTLALTQFRRLGEARGAAECLVGFGAVAAAEGRAAEGRAADAARLMGAGEAALAALGTPLWPSNRPDYEHWRALARRGLSVANFDQAWAEGQALSLEVAMTLALEPNATGAASPRSAQPEAVHLTPREREVAQLAARGLTNRQIAAALEIAEKTAANHLQRALEKLGLHRRAELAARAAEFGLTPGEAEALERG